MIEGTLEAADHQTVVARLQEQGQLPITVSSAKEGGIMGREFQLFWKRKKVSHHDLLELTKGLFTLIQAGLTLDRSLRILSELTENTYLKEVVRELLKEIKGGKSLSEALGMYPGVFPKVYTNMVKAGEAGGSLDQILNRLVNYMEEVEELRSYLISALIYPAILTAVAGTSIVIMIIFVIPQFAAIFENAGAPMPLPMAILLNVSGILNGFWWAILAVGVVSWWWIRGRLKTEEGRLKWDERILSLPLLGPVVQKVEVSRFSRSLGILLKSTVPLIESLNIVKEIVENQVIVSAMEPIKSGVKKGEGLADPIREAAIFPPFALYLLEVGEETGRLDDMLLQIADTYDRELRISLKRLIALFEPAVILVMAIIIGVMVVSLLHSIMSINDVPL